MNDTNNRTEYAQRRAVWLRNYQRQRGRALTRLCQENPDRYKELLEEERARDEAEGKAWLDIYGRTRNSAGLARHTAPTSTEGRPNQADRNGGEEGNLGGEA
jgi:hypothetical protein